MKLIELSQNKECIVDEEDFTLLSQWSWYYDTGYATRHNGNKKVRMHRQLTGNVVGFVVDHINGNTLDNRKSNLRLCSVRDNIRNRKLNKNNKSGYKGVSWDIKANKWRARIMINRKEKHLGTFGNKVDAAKCYDSASIKYFGEFGKLNFKKEENK